MAMATKTATRSGVELEPIDRLEDKVRRLVGLVERMKSEQARAAEENQRLTRELEEDMRSDLIAQFETQLRRDYPVEVDGAAINRLIGEDGLTPGAPASPLPGGPS